MLTAQRKLANQNLRPPASGEMNKRGSLLQANAVERKGKVDEDGRETVQPAAILLKEPARVFPNQRIE